MRKKRSRYKMRFLAFFVILLSFLRSIPSFSYAFTEDFKNGAFWRRFPIDIVVIHEGTHKDDLIYRLFQDAEREWESALGLDLWKIVEDDTPKIKGQYPKNYIKWSKNFYEETGRDPKSTLGVTVRRTNDNGLILSAAVILNANHFRLNNDTRLLYKTILHELGHTLQLDHTKERAIMADSEGASRGIFDLQVDDVNGGSALIEETLNRRNQLSLDENNRGDNLGPTCGSLAFISNNDHRGGSGPAPKVLSLLFILSFLFPFTLMKIFPVFFKKQFAVINF